MSDKLQELTNKLYKDGIQRAENEAQGIIAQAKEKQALIIVQAQKKAANLREEAQNEARDIKARATSEMSLAARQTEITLKAGITNLLSDEILNKDIATTLADKNLLGTMIEHCLSAWTSGKTMPDLVLILSDRVKGDFSNSLATSLKKKLENTPTIQFDQQMKNGFRLEAKDNSYAISFADSDFQEFFRSFFREQTRKILFGES